MVKWLIPTAIVVSTMVSAQNIEDLVSVIGTVALHISGAYEATLDNIDPDDNMFLAAAYESKANYLVSLDKKHLLPLKHYHGTQIVESALFIRLLRQDITVAQQL